MADNVEGVNHPFGLRPVDRERKPAQQPGGDERRGGPDERGDAPETPLEMEHTLRELEVAVAEINRRIDQMGQNIFLEIITTPSGPAVHIVDTEHSSALDRKGWEVTRRITPADALKWLERMQKGEGLIVDEDA